MRLVAILFTRSHFSHIANNPRRSTDAIYHHREGSAPSTNPTPRMPPHVPEIAHDDSAIHSLDKDDPVHLQTSYAQQGLESERAEEAAQQAEKEAREFGRTAENKANELEKDAKSKAQELKKDAKEGGAKAKKQAKDAANWADENKDNPVVIGNAVALAAIAAGLGFGAYRKHVAGELTWKIAGLWAGAVAAFGVGDFYFSQ